MKLAVAVVGVIALAHAHAAHASCRDRSHVVGREHCRRLGTGWSRDVAVLPYRIEIGWIYETFTPRAIALSGGTIARVGAAAGDAAAAPHIASDGETVRWLVGTRTFYGGLELSTLFFDPPHVADFTAEHSTALQPLAVVGAHASVWRVELAAELAGGPRIGVFDYCAETAAPCTTATAVTQVTGVLDARAIVAVFPAPSLSIGVAVGQNALDVSDHSVAIVVGLHVRPFDGMH